MWRAWWFVVVIACGGGGMSSPPCVGPDCPCAVTEGRCDGVCIDVASDPLNCGDCGHDCLGARCSDGVCMPETVAILPGVPVSMTMHGDELLVATSGEIASSGRLYRLPKAGGTADLTYRELGRVPTVAVDGDRILVGESSDVFNCEISNASGGLLSIGLDNNVSVLSRGRRCIHLLNAAEDGLFWVEENAVEFLAPAASAPMSLFDGTLITYLEPLDADTLLLLELSGNSSILKTIPRAGGPATSLLTLDGRALAVRDGQVAFARGSDIVVHTVATGTETRIPNVGSDIAAITLDASFVYWLSSGALVIGDPLLGTQRELARVGGFSLLQDETFVYVLSRDDTAARISRIRKPATVRPSSGVFGCEPPLRGCESGACTDPMTDRFNCGDCGRVCAAGEVCEAGECACAPAFVCAGSCVDLMVDDQHCGECDHACPGSCVGGVCAPIALTAFGPNPTNVFAQDDASIYFGRGNGLSKLDKQTHAVSVVNTLEFMGSIAVDTSLIYMTESGLNSNIHAVDKTGASSSVVYSNRPDARQIGLMGNTLVWTEDEDFGDDTRKLVRAAKDGSGILSSLTAVGVVPHADVAFSIGYVIDGETVYWLLDTLDFGGAVTRVDFSISPPTISLVTLLDQQPTSIALRGDDLLVSMEHNENPDNAAIVSIPKAGGAPTLVANAATPSALEVSPDGHVSWIEREIFVRRLDPVLELPHTVTSSTQHASVIISVDDGFYVATSVGILFVKR